MKALSCLIVPVFVLTAFKISAATLYVSLESTNPISPYATWETAARVIQDAVDAAKAGDTVLVTNGVYAVGSREVTLYDEYYGQIGGASRVVVTNAVRLDSVNGPLLTIIQGSQLLDEHGVATNGIRCVSLGINAVLSGFTLTNGFAGGGGGAHGGRLYNCVLTDNSAGVGGGALSSVLSNCTLSSNSAGDCGGGAWWSELFNCTLTGNSADDGGGAGGCTLNNCTLTGNWARRGGGGAVGGTLYNCTLTGNSAANGGGAGGGTLYNCTLTGNFEGGGAQGSVLYNCTVTGNTGGGVLSGRCAKTKEACSWPVFNSIVYYNSGGNYDGGIELNYCCTIPLPDNGVGNIDADPRFVNAAAGDFRLRPDSPCIDAGTNLSSLIQTDIEGQFRPQDGNKDGVAAFDIGAYEFRPSPVALYVSLLSTNPIPPYATWETAANVIQDAVDAAKAGDTVLVTNGVYAVGSRDVEMFDQWGFWWAELSRVAVTNAIRLGSVNGPSVTAIDGGWDEERWSGNGVRCVYLGDNAVLSGFTLTHGRAWDGGGAWCLSDAILTNCVLVANSAGSANSDEDWVWPHRGGYGGGVYGGTLYSCTLEGNVAPAWAAPDNPPDEGGGAAFGTLYNCMLSGNSAGAGGGVAYCTLHDCVLTGNVGGRAENGGAYGCTLYNCLLTSNSGGSDGTFYNCTVIDNQGDISGTAFNSVIYYNSGGNYAEGTVLNYCCTSPMPTNGVGNITGPPLFMDMGVGDHRLREDSPCIDAGTNLVGFTMTITNVDTGDISVLAYAHEPTDILGNTRFIDGNGDGKVAWDIGAYEFNSFRPPRFAVQPQRTAEGWVLNITGAPNKWVHLERSGNLRDWEEIWSAFMWEANQQVNHADTESKVMFYRVVVQ